MMPEERGHDIYTFRNLGLFFKGRVGDSVYGQNCPDDHYYRIYNLNAFLMFSQSITKTVHLSDRQVYNNNINIQYPYISKITS